MRVVQNRSRSSGKLRDTHPWTLSKLDWTMPCEMSCSFGIDTIVSKKLDWGPPEVPPHLNYSMSQSMCRLFWLFQSYFPLCIAPPDIPDRDFWSLIAYRYCCSVCNWWYHIEKKTCLVPPWLILPRRFFLSSKLGKYRSSSFFYATLSSPLLLSPKMSQKLCSFSLKFPKRTFYPGIISCLRKFSLVIFCLEGESKFGL